MLFFENASDNKDFADDVTVLVSQFRAAGVDAVIATSSLPRDMSRNAQFDIAPLIEPRPIGAGDHLVILQADQLSAGRSAGYRRLSSEPLAGVSAAGPFPTLQSRISVRTRLSYVLQADPEIVDTTSWDCCLPVFGVNAGKGFRRGDKPEILLLSPPMETDEERAALQAWIASSRFSVSLMATGKLKEAWSAKEGTGVRVYHYSELLPISFAPMFDAVIAFTSPKSSYRSKCLIANMAAAGAVLADCSAGGRYAATDTRWLTGPADVRSAHAWFSYEIFPHLDAVRSEMARSAPVGEIGPDAALAALAAPHHRFIPAADQARMVIMPTNGIGLGHAQRCSLIAGEMDQEKPVFAAFPSCMRMLQGYGFDVMPLVSRSDQHKQEHDNDALNRMRLSALCAEGGTFVFDGGYVFDSVVRTITEKRMRGIWIRRGMWQAGQSNAIALDREKVFHKVIVPSECFPELNDTYSSGGHVETVGPIVQRVGLKPAGKRKLRKKLEEEFGPFDRLVVTMLGGGVAADRSVQLSAIAATLSAHPGTLHLVVTWPTAKVPPALYGWKNTRVVKTHHASVLVAAADLYISAVGYNSFHEAMYNAVPTIFMAQMNQFMDDQQKRAMAAVDRGLSDIVAPDQMSLMASLISAHLDGGRKEEIAAAFRAVELPEPGNAVAARIISGETAR